MRLPWHHAAVTKGAYYTNDFLLINIKAVIGLNGCNLPVVLLFWACLEARM